jgi:hypothetical protein
MTDTGRAGPLRDCYDHPEKSREHEVGMAVFHLHSAMQAVSEMSRSEDYRDLLIDQSGRIAEVALACNLVWSQIMQRRAA